MSALTILKKSKIPNQGSSINAEEAQHKKKLY
jgi:hypothetical protein